MRECEWIAVISYSFITRLIIEASATMLPDIKAFSVAQQSCPVFVFACGQHINGTARAPRARPRAKACEKVAGIRALNCYMQYVQLCHLTSAECYKLTPASFDIFYHSSTSASLGRGDCANRVTYARDRSETHDPFNIHSVADSLAQPAM